MTSEIRLYVSKCEPFFHLANGCDGYVWNEVRVMEFGYSQNPVANDIVAGQRQHQAFAAAILLELFEYPTRTAIYRRFQNNAAVKFMGPGECFGSLGLNKRKPSKILFKKTSDAIAGQPPGKDTGGVVVLIRPNDRQLCRNGPRL